MTFCAFEISEDIYWSCVGRDLPFVCFDFDAGAAFNHRQSPSRLRNREGKFVFHEEALPVKTRSGRPIMAWRDMTKCKATVAAFFAEVDSPDEMVEQGQGGVVEVTEDAVLQEADDSGVGEFDLPEAMHRFTT